MREQKKEKHSLRPFPIFNQFREKTARAFKVIPTQTEENRLFLIPFKVGSLKKKAGGGKFRKREVGWIFLEFLFLICFVFGFLAIVRLIEERGGKEIQKQRLKGSQTERVWKL